VRSGPSSHRAGGLWLATGGKGRLCSFTLDAILFIKTPITGGFVTEIAMEPLTRSLSTQESKVVLALTERGRREATRAEIVDLLGGSAKAADHVIESLRRKGCSNGRRGASIFL
jgi:hypothetical protein